MTTNSKEYNIAYKKENLKRVPLDLRKDQYLEVRAAAERAGMSVNGFIKAAINEKIEREKE